MDKKDSIVFIDEDNYKLNFNEGLSDSNLDSNWRIL